MEDLQCLIYDYSIEAGVSEPYSKALNMLALLIALLVIIVIADYITRKVLINVFNGLAAKSKTNFDDLLINHKAPRNIAH